MFAFALTWDPVPSAPQNLIALGMSSSQIDLDWDDTTYADDYTVEKKVGTGGSWGMALDDITQSDCSITGLDPAQLYYFRVKANNESGTSGSVALMAILVSTPSLPFCAPIGLRVGFRSTLLTISRNVVAAERMGVPSSLTFTIMRNTPVLLMGYAKTFKHHF